MNSLAELKSVLFSILEGAFVTPDIQATQQLGVNLSNAVKRDNGVMIIQNQSIEVYARIVPSIVKSIKMCDSIADSFVPPMLPPPIEIKQLESSETDPIDECCAFLYEQNIGWEDMQSLMKARYAEFVIGKYETKLEAAKYLKIQPTYLSKITSLTPKLKKESKHENKKMVII